jgi:hypothetical protein
MTSCTLTFGAERIARLHLDGGASDTIHYSRLAQDLERSARDLFFVFCGSYFVKDLERSARDLFFVFCRSFFVPYILRFVA